MRGLTVVVADGSDRSRLRTALATVAAQAALGGRARLFLDGAAVRLLHAADPDDDARYREHGLPSLAELVDTAVTLGGVVTLCQSGLALCTLSPADFAVPVSVGGLVTLLAELDDDRLLAY